MQALPERVYAIVYESYALNLIFSFNGCIVTEASRKNAMMNISSQLTKFNY